MHAFVFFDVLLAIERAAALALLLDVTLNISPFVKRLNTYGDASQLYSKSRYVEIVVPTIAPKSTRRNTLRIDSMTLAHLCRKVMQWKLASKRLSLVRKTKVLVKKVLKIPVEMPLSTTLVKIRCGP